MRGWVVAALASVAISAPGAARGDFARTLTGPAAYGDWRIDAPGLRFRITPADLPPPNASPLDRQSHAPEVARPPDALPKAPFGFTVDILATGPQPAARAAHRAERRRLHRRKRRRPRAGAAQRRRRQAGHERVRRQPRPALRDRVLSAGPRPEIRLCRNARSGLPLPLQIRRPRQFGNGREGRRPARRRRKLDARSRRLRRRQDDLRLGRIGLQRRARI